MSYVLYRICTIKIDERWVCIMYYNRTLTDDFAQLLMAGGQLRWWYDFVKSRVDLDFLIGKNNKAEFISIYRGLTRIMTIKPTRNAGIVNIDAAPSYKEIAQEFFGVKSVSSITKEPIELIINHLMANGIKDRYYGNKKEGYYQNELSRKYGICSSDDSDFVIIDKEAVIGYENESEKKQLFSSLQDGYKELQRKISNLDSDKYGKDLDKRAIGNELDFLALNKNGDVLLIEYKHGSNTSGIYLSPLQIGLYYDNFSLLPKKVLQDGITRMFEQKQRIGLINEKWKKPELSGRIIPVLIISNPNIKSSACTKFYEILEFCKKSKGSDFLRNLKTYSYTTDGGLVPWGNT